MKYRSAPLEERVDLLIREELNYLSQNHPDLEFEDSIAAFIGNLTRRITELIQDETKFRRDVGL